MDQVRRRVKEESGATSVEYAIMVGLIVVVIAAAVTALGGSLIPVFNNIANGIGS